MDGLHQAHTPGSSQTSLRALYSVPSPVQRNEAQRDEAPPPIASQQPNASNEIEAKSQVSIPVHLQQLSI